MTSKWPILTENMIIAACQGHFGKDATHIDGIDITADGINWSFRQAFKRMWNGARNASKVKELDGWICVKDAMPPSSAALDDPSLVTADMVLMTNMIDGRDRMGRMSHVWLGTVHVDEENDSVYGYTSDVCQRIYNVTHWKPIN